MDLEHELRGVHPSWWRHVEAPDAGARRRLAARFVRAADLALGRGEVEPPEVLRRQIRALAPVQLSAALRRFDPGGWSEAAARLPASVRPAWVAAAAAPLPELDVAERFFAAVVEWRAHPGLGRVWWTAGLYGLACALPSRRARRAAAHRLPRGLGAALLRVEAALPPLRPSPWRDRLREIRASVRAGP